MFALYRTHNILFGSPSSFNIFFSSAWDELFFLTYSIGFFILFFWLENDCFDDTLSKWLLHRNVLLCYVYIANAIFRVCENCILNTLLLLYNIYTQFDRTAAVMYTYSFNTNVESCGTFNFLLSVDRYFQYHSSLSF